MASEICAHRPSWSCSCSEPSTQTCDACLPAHLRIAAGRPHQLISLIDPSQTVNVLQPVAEIRSLTYESLLESDRTNLWNVLEQVCVDARKFRDLTQKHQQLLLSLKPRTLSSHEDILKGVKYLQCMASIPDDSVTTESHWETLISEPETASAAKDFIETQLALPPACLNLISHVATQVFHTHSAYRPFVTAAMKQADTPQAAEAVVSLLKTCSEFEVTSVVEEIVSIIKCGVQVEESCQIIRQVVGYFKTNTEQMRQSLTSLQILLQVAHSVHQPLSPLLQTIHHHLTISPDLTHRSILLFGNLQAHGNPNSLPFLSRLLDQSDKCDPNLLKRFVTAVDSNADREVSRLMVDFYMMERGPDVRKRLEFGVLCGEFENRDMTIAVLTRLQQLYRENEELESIWNVFIDIYVKLALYLQSSSKWITYLEVLSGIDPKFVPDALTLLTSLSSSINPESPTDSLPILDTAILQTIANQFVTSLEVKIPAYKSLKDAVIAEAWGPFALECIKSQFDQHPPTPEDHIFLTILVHAPVFWQAIARLTPATCSRLLTCFRVAPSAASLGSITLVAQVAPKLTQGALETVIGRLSDTDKVQLLISELASLIEIELISPLISVLLERYIDYIQANFTEPRVYLSIAKLAFETENAAERLAEIAKVSEIRFIAELAGISGGEQVVNALLYLSDHYSEEDLSRFAEKLIEKIKENGEWVDVITAIKGETALALSRLNSLYEFRPVCLSVSKTVLKLTAHGHPASEFLSTCARFLTKQCFHPALTVICDEIHLSDNQPLTLALLQALTWYSEVTTGHTEWVQTGETEKGLITLGNSLVNRVKSSRYYQSRLVAGLYSFALSQEQTLHAAELVGQLVDSLPEVACDTVETPVESLLQLRFPLDCLCPLSRLILARYPTEAASLILTRLARFAEDRDTAIHVCSLAVRLIAGREDLAEVAIQCVEAATYCQGTSQEISSVFLQSITEVTDPAPIISLLTLIATDKDRLARPTSVVLWHFRTVYKANSAFSLTQSTTIVRSWSGTVLIDLEERYRKEGYSHLLSVTWLSAVVSGLEASEAGVEVWKRLLEAVDSLSSEQERAIADVIQSVFEFERLSNTGKIAVLEAIFSLIRTNPASIKAAITIITRIWLEIAAYPDGEQLLKPTLEQFSALDFTPDVVTAYTYIVSQTTVLQALGQISTVKYLHDSVITLLTAANNEKTDCIWALARVAAISGDKLQFETIKSLVNEFSVSLCIVLKELEKVIAVNNDVLTELMFALIEKINENNTDSIATLAQMIGSLPPDFSLSFIDRFITAISKSLSTPDNPDTIFNQLLTDQKLLLELIVLAEGDFEAILGMFTPNPCKICHFRILSRDEFRLPCDDSYHKNCLHQFCERIVTAPQVSCPSCGAPIPRELLEKLLSPDLYQIYLTTHVIERGSLKLKCPGCQQQCPGRDSLEIGDSAKIKCDGCAYEFCGITGTKWTEPHDKNRCQFDYSCQFILEMSKDCPDNVSQCPNCYMAAYIVDTNNVTCPICNIRFCFKCSALQLPINMHNNMWHRPNCSLYVQMKNLETEKMVEKCPECQKLGKRCEPPNALRTQRRFEFDETQLK